MLELAIKKTYSHALIHFHTSTIWIRQWSRVKLLLLLLFCYAFVFLYAIFLIAFIQGWLYYIIVNLVNINMHIYMCMCVLLSIHNIINIIIITQLLLFTYFLVTLGGWTLIYAWQRLTACNALHWLTFEGAKLSLLVHIR